MLKKILKQLKKELGLQYPPHHWKHIKVWSAYWKLISEVKEGGELKWQE